VALWFFFGGFYQRLPLLLAKPSYRGVSLAFLYEFTFLADECHRIRDSVFFHLQELEEATTDWQQLFYRAVGRYIACLIGQLAFLEG